MQLFQIAYKGDFRYLRTLWQYALQSLTGKYREIQGKPWNENWDPAMRTGFPCNESRFFPVGIDLQGKAVSCTGPGLGLQCSLSMKIYS